MATVVFGRRRGSSTVADTLSAPRKRPWSGPPSDELFQWWLDQERASDPSLYGRKPWETMSSYWPTSSPKLPRRRPGVVTIAVTGG